MKKARILALVLPALALPHATAAIASATRFLKKLFWKLETGAP